MYKTIHFKYLVFIIAFLLQTSSIFSQNDSLKKHEIRKLFLQLLLAQLL